MFCSTNYSPILDRLHEISDRFRCYYHYTITAYGTDIKPRMPSIEQSIESCRRLAAQVGSEKIAWRYDPASPLLLGHLKETDVVKLLRQASLLTNELTLL